MKRRFWLSLGLLLRKGSVSRANYLRKKNVFAGMGKNVRYQPHQIPLYPELIRLHNNIMIAAGVCFVTHDAANKVISRINQERFPERVGCIEVMDNVFIGYNVTILPNVRIGNNVIIGADSTVTKDLEPNGVYVGSPARRIGSFDDYVKKISRNSKGEFDYPYISHNQRIESEEIERAWEYFRKERE